MKINLILILLFISTILSAQRFRQDISNFATNDALRNDFVVPKANDKVYVIATMKLYNYDASDTSTADDDETVIVQGTRRWKCLNCSSGSGTGVTDGNKGDITVDGDDWQINLNAIGSLEIAPNAVVTAKIADSNVTSNKLAITGVTAGTYKSVTVNTKGQVTAGSNPDSLNVFDGTNTFRYKDGELEIYNNVDNKSVAFQNGRIHISRDGDVADQDTDVLIRSEIEDLIVSGGSGVPYENASQDTLKRPSGIVIGDVDGIGEGSFYENGGNSHYFGSNIYSGSMTFYPEDRSLLIAGSGTDKTEIFDGYIKLTRNATPTEPNDVLTLSETGEMIKDSLDAYTGSAGSKWYIVTNITDTTSLTGMTIFDKLLVTSNGFTYSRESGYWNWSGGTLKGAAGTGVQYKGTWGELDYAVNDIVIGTDNNLYICKLAVTANYASRRPVSGGFYSTYWDLFLPKGIQGDTGPAGATGAAGAGISDGDKGDITVTGLTNWAIDNSTITSAKIVDATVTGSDIKNETITSGKILDGTIASGDLASNAVTTAKIADSNVTTAKIADSNVTTAKIADSNVTTAKIADANVTVAKISATGTASSTTYLRGDGSWSTPSGG
jgi:hypothetical protein